jgi:hypothetical protein
MSDFDQLFGNLDQSFGFLKCFYCGRKDASGDLELFNEPGREDLIIVCNPCLSHLLKHYKSDGFQTMTYRDYLCTEHWYSVRRNALAAAGRRCQLCNAADQVLDVHHRTYERLGKEKLSDLIVLCRSCHERHHVAGK